MNSQNAAFAGVLDAGKDAFIANWLAAAFTGDPHQASGMKAEAHALYDAFLGGVKADGVADELETSPAWAPLRDALTQLSGARAAQGASAAETSRFVLAIKKPVFAGLEQRHGGDPKALMAHVGWATSLVDKMAQWTAGTYQRAREETIKRQQMELLELSTPVVKLWEGVLAVPMIGTLDSSRTQLVMETLLQRIVETGSELAIIDITGVPTVDTLVAQHLLKTVTAIRLMGADCIISGIRPQIAQTIVHLGIDLQGITTKASLADALALALRLGGYVVARPKAVA